MGLVLYSMNSITEALGVDVGMKRIGIARINTIARIPHPVETVEMNDAAPARIAAIAESERSDVIVVGVPVTENGKDSEQTKYCREFAAKLKEQELNVVFQDETLSTHAASEMIASGRYSKNSVNKKPGIDEIAACVILSDFISDIDREK